jgi:pimeloyl-ACP methyl ester carboxylesterase
MPSLAYRVLLVCALVWGAAQAQAQAPAPAAPARPSSAPPAQPAPSAPPAPAPRNDYAQAENWLCLPGHNAACDANLDTTVIAASGATTVEKFAVAKAPSIDCFYVYPTVSRDPGVVATMKAEPEELGVVAQQFARFAQVCRPFAPLYRQFTLTALVARMSGKPLPSDGIDPKIGYNDVVDAWNYYLAHYNNGRGVVLIGHSQGSSVLTALIKNEIEGKPVQKKLVSAILMGTRLQVPAGKDVGGDFAAVPLCHAASQTGCAIAYASFRATAPPAATSLFGKPAGPGLEAACVNPAALAGGSGTAHAYFAARTAIVETSSQVDWVKGKTIDTPFVSVPGLLTAECKKNDVATYLAVAVHGEPGSARTPDIPGDVVVGGQVRADWGLHLIDAGLFIGNLIAIVRDEAAAYARGKH